MPRNSNGSLEKRFGQKIAAPSPSSKQSNGKGRVQKTVYLPPALAKRLNFASVEEEREISELVTDALVSYLESKTLEGQ